MVLEPKDAPAGEVMGYLNDVVTFTKLLATSNQIASLLFSYSGSLDSSLNLFS